MKIVYASRTGNVEAFVEKLGYKDVFRIDVDGDKVDDKYVLITYTDGYGDVPEEVLNFLDGNSENLVAVAASGDQGYGDAFCGSANVISEQYNVPILVKFEFDGTDEDVQKFKEEFEKLN